MPPYYRLPLETNDRFYTRLVSVLSSSFNGWYEVSGEQRKRGWVFTDETLAYFMMNFTVAGCKNIHVECAGELETISRAMMAQGMNQLSTHVFESSSGMRIIIHPTKTINEMIEVFPADCDRFKIQLPKNIGTTLDSFDLNWTENTKRLPKPERINVFFDKERRKNGHDLIHKMLECGERAGIRNKMFLAFGNLLGYVITGDFLPNDTDIDMNILADEITQEQRHQYLMGCKKAGLMEHRMRGPTSIAGKYSWFSIGPKSPYRQHGVKSCNWFWFSHGGYLWHSKGRRWIGRASLSDKYPTAKGIPQKVFTGFKTIEFGGNKILAPQKIGTCLDYWYGNWCAERSCSSTINTILVMPDERNRKTWYITTR